jgi:membrane-associated protease RseP (regulator of RpoE activity)
MSEPTQEPDALTPAVYRRPLTLFLLTVASVFITGVSQAPGERTMLQALRDPYALGQGAAFACSLLGILLAHEFGHYIAARLHRVPASLPHFIPMPFLSPFGTMGAVIRMRGRITSRRALLDIGAAGPLAGMVLAVPIYAYGVAHSEVKPLVSDGTATQLGNSLLLSFLDARFGPHVPQGHDVFLSPMAFAGWAGMFVTMINLIPVAQLDGGHVAYALFGERHHRYARGVHWGMLLFFLGSVAVRIVAHVRAHDLTIETLGQSVSASMFWFLWFEMLIILSSFSASPEPGAMSPRTRISMTVLCVLLAGVAQSAHKPWLWLALPFTVALLIGFELTSGVVRDRAMLQHPPTDAEPLGLARGVVAVGTLLLFVLLFMPTPMSL